MKFKVGDKVTIQSDERIADLCEDISADVREEDITREQGRRLKDALRGHQFFTIRGEDSEGYDLVFGDLPLGYSLPAEDLTPDREGQDYDSFCHEQEVSSVKNFLRNYTPEEKLKFVQEICPEFISDSEAVKAQAARIRELVSENVKLTRQVEALQKIGGLYGVLNAVRITLRLPQGTTMQDLIGLLPRMDAVLKETEAAAEL